MHTGHSDGTVVIVLHCRVLDCGFKSDWQLRLWVVSLWSRPKPYAPVMTGPKAEQLKSTKPSSLIHTTKYWFISKLLKSYTYGYSHSTVGNSESWNPKLPLSVGCFIHQERLYPNLRDAPINTSAAHDTDDTYFDLIKHSLTQSVIYVMQSTRPGELLKL